MGIEDKKKMSAAEIAGFVIGPERMILTLKKKYRVPSGKFAIERVEVSGPIKIAAEENHGD